MKGRYELLVFDWDGTLFDSISWIVRCLQLAAAETGLDVPSESQARSVIGLSLGQAMELLYPGATEAMAQQLVKHYREHYHQNAGARLGLFEGVESALHELRDRGYKLAVATGKARSGLDHALRETGLTEFFHATRCADETLSKPHPRMIHELLAELQVSQARTLLVGDSLHDLRMAENAGIDVVAVTCGANSHAELSAYHPLLCLDGTPELLEHL